MTLTTAEFSAYILTLWFLASTLVFIFVPSYEDVKAKLTFKERDKFSVLHIFMYFVTTIMIIISTLITIKL